MKVSIFLPMIFLMSCGTLPQLYQTTENIADDVAIKVEISKEAIQKNEDIQVEIQLKSNLGK